MSAKWSGANAVSCFYFHWNVSNWQDFLIVPRSGAYSAELSSRAQQLHPQSDSPESCTFTKKERNLSTAIYSLDSLYTLFCARRGIKRAVSVAAERVKCVGAHFVCWCVCARISRRELFLFSQRAIASSPYSSGPGAVRKMCAACALGKPIPRNGKQM